MNKISFGIIFFLILLILPLFFSANKIYAQCGAGYYCSGSQAYLKITACEDRGNVVPPHGCSQQYCYNKSSESATANCSDSTCTGLADGSLGCTSVPVVYRVRNGVGVCECASGPLSGTVSCCAAGSPSRTPTPRPI